MIPRASKRRSPLPLFDSDSTPEGSETSSSDESNAPLGSQDVTQQVDIPQIPLPKIRLILKLRAPRSSSSPPSSQTSSPKST